MRKRTIFILVSSILCFGVAPSAFGGNLEQLQQSRKKWQKFCNEIQGNYSYQVSFSSFTGYGTVTEIIVRDNKVTERRFREIDVTQPSKPGDKPNDKWIEKGKELGRHKEGAAASTMEELYQEAERVLKRKLPEHEKLYLKFDKRGLLQSCFTVDTRIADDAPINGVQISKLILRDDNANAVHKSPNGKPYPKHWGAPPLRQTRDLRQLPGGFGMGSGTLAQWITDNMEKDAKKNPKEDEK